MQVILWVEDLESLGSKQEAVPPGRVVSVLRKLVAVGDLLLYPVVGGDLLLYPVVGGDFPLSLAAGESEEVEPEFVAPPVL